MIGTMTAMEYLNDFIKSWKLAVNLEKILNTERLSKGAVLHGHSRRHDHAKN